MPYEIRLEILLGDTYEEFEVTKLKFDEIHLKHKRKDKYTCSKKEKGKDLCDLKTLLYTIAREDNVRLSFARTEDNKNAADFLKAISEQHDIDESASLEWAYLYVVKSGASIKTTDPHVKFSDLRVYDFHIEDAANYRFEIRGAAVPKNM